ncbi:patatin-like phospholipase family protein [Nitrosophilus labii]|uniref:patatin-like phospholipase family protein n=1 Tax=Nitrosophilus labii TaxID=2706014 RepID=UPI001656F505|nr:patatin-like phospholipase family protein [Nitrosophilus labii]
MKRAAVFSGGGARCMAQLGYLSFLKEMGVEFECYSGVSGGAIVASFLAKGYKPKEIFEILKSIDYKKLIKLNIFGGSIFHLKKVYPLLRDFGLKDFSDLKYKLYVAVTDYETYETIYRDSGDLAKYLIASSSLIPVFSPFEVDGRVYIDGGFTDNLPVTPCVDSDFILAINVNPPLRFKNSLWGNFYRAGYIMLNTNIRYSKQKAHKYVEIKKCGVFSIFDTKNFDKIYEAGYEEAENDIEFWKRI